MKENISVSVIHNDGFITRLEEVVDQILQRKQPCFIPLIRKNDCAVIMNVNVFNAMVKPEFIITQDVASAMCEVVEDYVSAEANKEETKQ